MNYIRFLYQVCEKLIEKRYNFNRARTFYISRLPARSELECDIIIIFDQFSVLSEKWH